MIWQIYTKNTYNITFDISEEAIKDTVPKQRKNYEVDGGPHARLNPSLRSNPIIHHLIPVLSSQNLRKHTHSLKETIPASPGREVEI